MAREQVALVRAAEVNGGQIVAGSRVITFDAVISETPSDIATPTNFPIETGADITDHVRIEPITLDMDVVFTDTQLRTAPEADAIRDRAFDQYRQLVEIEASRETFDIVRTYRTFPNMLLTSIKPRRDQQSGRANLRIKLSFKEIRTVAFQKTFIPTEEIEAIAAQRAQAEVDRDRQRQRDPTPEESNALLESLNFDGFEQSGARGRSIAAGLGGG